MSSEQVYTEEVVPKVVQKKEPSCAITSEGITFMGFQVSWLVILLVAVVLYFVLRGTQMDSVFGDPSSSPNVSMSSSPSVSMRPSMGPGGISANVSAPRMPAPEGPGGEIARMFGHNRW
jgi:hypothetical protein